MTQRTRTRDLIHDAVTSASSCTHINIDDCSFMNYGRLYFNHFEDFPTTGHSNVLYFNQDTNTLYCWDNELKQYIMINTTTLEKFMIDGGGAEDE